MLTALEKDGSNLNHEQYQQVTDERGYTREFLLDKELTLLLVTGYSVPLRHKVIKRWKELENQVQQPRLTPHREALGIAKEALEVAEAGNQAKLSANKLVKSFTEVDLLESMGQTQLLAEKQALTFTPTELGKRLKPPVSAVAFNKRLKEAGLQVKIGKAWEPTAEGLEYCEVLDTGKQHSNGTPIKQVKWFESVIDLV